MAIKKILSILFITALFFLSNLSITYSQYLSGAKDPENGRSDQKGIRFITSSLTTPTFNASIRIKAGNSAMKVDASTSVPCVVDWNGDGKKDLLVGCFYDGNVYLYLNSGTNNSPVFTAGAKLKADGSEISVVYG